MFMRHCRIPSDWVLVTLLYNGDITLELNDTVPQIQFSRLRCLSLWLPPKGRNLLFVVNTVTVIAPFFERIYRRKCLVFFLRFDNLIHNKMLIRSLSVNCISDAT